MNKQFTIVIIILSILLLCGNVYAEDPENPETPEDTPDENIEQTNVNTYNDFKNAMTHIKTSTNKNHEINLKQNTYTLGKTFTGDLNSSYEKNIIINGNHSTIDGQNQYGFLIIPRNAKISINNLTITNMNRKFAPAIRAYGNLSLENVTFINNNADQIENEILGGGAIFTEESINMTHCTFKNNGGNIDGSTIFIKENKNTDNQININNCTFQNNTSIKGSTIKILGQTTVNIHNSTFITENANNSIIDNTNSKVNITHCSFTNENSTNIITNNYECNMDNILIYDNNISNILASNHNLIINNSRIYDNQIKNLLYYIKNVTIENSVINNNLINESLIQNEIYQNDNVEYIFKFGNVTIANNTANKTCGIKNEYENCYTFIENSTFINNTSLLDEGIISDYYGKMHIFNTQFHNNTSEDLFKGNLETFKQVINNEYKGNYLKIYLNTSSTYDYSQLNINGSLETDKIYNTTVQTGNIILKQDNINIYEEIVTDNNFSINYPYSGELNNLKMYYNGVSDFRNSLQDLEVQILKEEYDIEIRNISKSFVYGDYITFDLIIKNSGNIPANNIHLRNVLPNELAYVNSTDNFDNENNDYYLNTLDLNENKTVQFNLIPIRYEDLNIEFNIFDEKQDTTYQFTEEILFIKPKIMIDKVIAHPGDTINISTRIDNYKRDILDNIIFSFNYKRTNDFSYNFNNNILTIENYKLSESLTKKDYLIELICNSKDLEEFSNTSKISVRKYDTHSVSDYNISNSYLNLSLKVLDENDKPVTGGSVMLKVNGKTVKSFIVSNGIINLYNYKLTSNYQNEYNITLTYTGNNKYNIHNNNITIKEDKKTLDFLIHYEINEKSILFSIKTVNDENILPENGYVAIKINNKTIIPKMIIQEEYILTYDFSDIQSIQSISVVYYGNENFIEKSKIIGFE